MRCMYHSPIIFSFLSGWHYYEDVRMKLRPDACVGTASIAPFIMRALELNYICDPVHLTRPH